jgi:hypothetical protein
MGRSQREQGNNGQSVIEKKTNYGLVFGIQPKIVLLFYCVSPLLLSSLLCCELKSLFPRVYYQILFFCFCTIFSIFFQWVGNTRILSVSWVSFSVNQIGSNHPFLPGVFSSFSLSSFLGVVNLVFTTLCPHSLTYYSPSL